MATFKIENKEISYSTEQLLADKIVVNSIPYPYTVRFVTLPQLKESLKMIKDANQRKHFVYIDSVVASLYGKNIFKGTDMVPFTAKETNKRLSSVTRLFDTLQKNNFTKREIFLSAGGGITQDVSSFARAAFKRGIRWTYLPTTLLAMGDSCIGAKACLNYDKIKNLLGLFSAPHEVLIHPGFLDTLSERDILSGYGEIIKLSIVGGKSAIETFGQIQESQHDNPLDQVEKMIKLSLLVKKSVIEIDEFENDIRRALNYGHTIGHAIEPLTGYRIPHGIAISIGMMMENLIASEWGSLSSQEAAYLNKLILPFIDKKSLGMLKNVSVKSVIQNMKRDKKALNDDIYMSVPAKIGHFVMLKVHSNNSFEKYLHHTFANISKISTY